MKPVIINPPWGELRQVNAILNGRNTTHSAVDYCGTLSIKCILSGEALYEADGCRYAVRDTNYLILNDRQTYTLTIAAEKPVETFCVFFRPDFAAAALSDLMTPADRLLDEPRSCTAQSVHFFARLYPHDEFVTPIIHTLHRAVQEGVASPGWYEERFHLLIDRLLRRHRGLRAEIERMPALRAATRAELYRRLHRARDYMEASMDEPLTLETIAGVAWLSPHHFLRLYKQAFGITPHQYLTQRRIEQAQRLLLQTEMSVTAIGLAVGIESPSAFSRLFRSQTGVSPGAFRRTREQ
jgi:AraC family transcriptional regulator